MEKYTLNKFDYNEESFKDKLKRGAGLLSLISTGLLSILHTLSHIVPAIGVLGLSFGNEASNFYKIVSNEYVQLAYLPFVALSFYYIYRDHQHHKHERELRKELYRVKTELDNIKKERQLK